MHLLGIIAVPKFCDWYQDNWYPYHRECAGYLNIYFKKIYLNFLHSSYVGAGDQWQEMKLIGR